MKNIKIQMVRENSNNIPYFEVPNGYRIRMFKKGDEVKWAEIETRAREFKSEIDASKRFKNEFKQHINEVCKRCIILETVEGEAIGTAMAWYGKVGKSAATLGRVHWVAIVPEYQGKGLSKPLLSKAMKILADYHNKFYLTSQTTSWRAINMYLNFGFVPLRLDDNFEESWVIIERVLNKKILS